MCVHYGEDLEVQSSYKQTRQLQADLLGNPRTAIDKEVFGFHYEKDTR